MFPIETNFIPNLPKTPYQNGVGQYEGVVMHATANNGDTADGERAFEVTHWKDAFVHFFVDHTKILQTADTAYKAYGAGGTANKSFVHMELCQTNNDGTAEAKRRFDEAYRRWIWLAAYTLFQRKLVPSPATLWSHRRVSAELGGTDHSDPDGYLATWGKTWTDVQKDVLREYASFVAPVKVSKAEADNALAVLGKAWGLTDAKGKAAVHDAANVLRKLSGQKEVN